MEIIAKLLIGVGLNFKVRLYLLNVAYSFLCVYARLLMKTSGNINELFAKEYTLCGTSYC